MTSLTDKMEALTKEDFGFRPCTEGEINILTNATSTIVEEDWEESLQAEALDDYLRLANSKYYIKEEDMPEYMEEMRNHYKKLVAFISSSIQQALTKAEEAPVEDWRERFKAEFGIHFSDSELLFAIAFFEEVLQEQSKGYVAVLNTYRCRPT